MDTNGHEWEIQNREWTRMDTKGKFRTTNGHEQVGGTTNGHEWNHEIQEWNHETHEKHEKRQGG